VIAALETLKDVTDQKRAEEELRSERDKFQGMLSAMVDGVDIINKDYIIEYQNDYLQRDFGDLRGKKCYTAYMGLEEPCDFCPIQESMRTGKKKRVEFVVVDGRVYELRTSPFKDVDGEVKVIELVRDITEHKQMLEKLKQSEKEHQMVLDSVPVSIFHIDRNSRFVQVNEVLANRYGMKPEDFKGKTTKELFPEQAESFADSDREVLESGEPQIGTLRKIKTSQGVRWVRLDKVPIKDAEGNVTSIIGFELDVTEREQIEEKLREREREHQTILDSVPASIFHIDRNSTFVQVNKTLATRYGKKPEDFKGKSTNELFPEQAESFVKSDREVLESGEPQIGVRKKIITPLGVRWMRIDKVPVKDADGNVTDLIGFELDVTNRKQTEEALRESEERFRSIVENSHDGILIINDAYQITYVNDELCRILGYSREESIGQDFRNFLDEESKQIITDRYIRRQKGENIPARYEFNIARKDGAKRRVEICSAAIKDSAGNVQTVAQILDITERKRAVEKLRQSEKEHQMILDSVPVSIFHIDRNSTFLQVNETLAKRYGMKPRDFKGKTTNELFPEQAESFAESDREVLESGEPQIGVIKKIGTPQGVRWVRLDKVPIKDAEGNVTGVVGFELDITDRKTAEDERKRLLKELEEKNSELEHFTYTVSHDLRSPLVTIQGFIGLLAMDLERDAKEKAANDLKYISSAATKMDELLNATLELSRIGRIANPPEDVPFGAIVEGALQQAAGAITANNIEVSVVDGFPVVHVDRMRMEEVLVNLITNSIKYRGEQPHPKIEIGHRVDGEETVFFVKDNGIGLDKIQHEEVFELFYQVSSGNGTGAGLAIVKRIVEVHEGRIWIESEKGKGCTVCFTLPVN
jgi:PAS domain S-box-containing protein